MTNTARTRDYCRVTGVRPPSPVPYEASLRAAVIQLLWLVVWRCQTYNEWVLLLGVWFDVAMTTTTHVVERRVQAPAAFSQCFSVALTCCPTQFQGWEQRRSSTPRDKTVAKLSQLPKKGGRNMWNINDLDSYNTGQEVTTATSVQQFVYNIGYIW